MRDSHSIADSLVASRWSLCRLVLVGSIVMFVSTAHADVVQISQRNIHTYINWVWDTTTSAGGWIHGDLTGDGIGDIAPYATATSGSSVSLQSFPNGTLWYSGAWGSSTKYVMIVDYQDSLDNVMNSGASSASTSGLINVSFSDARINGGAVTQGQMQISGWVLPPGATFYEYSLEITRVIFDDADPAGALVPTRYSNALSSYDEWVEVPEPATMSLLALGGIAMLRRRNPSI